MVSFHVCPRINPLLSFWFLSNFHFIRSQSKGTLILGEGTVVFSIKMSAPMTTLLRGMILAAALISFTFVIGNVRSMGVTSIHDRKISSVITHYYRPCVLKASQRTWPYWPQRPESMDHFCSTHVVTVCPMLPAILIKEKLATSSLTYITSEL